MSMQLTSVTTGQVRLNYVHLNTPYANKPGQEPKYSATILLPKSDIATKQRIDAAIAAAIQAGIMSKWNGARPPMISSPIWDGDGVRKNGDAFGPECRGHWVFTASSKQKQEIVDLNLNPIINQTEVYSGIYARVNINFFAFDTNGNRGIGCGLGPIQKVSDGEPLGGGVSAQEAFGGGAQQTQYAPPVQQYPQTVPQQQYMQPQPPQYTPPAQPQAQPQQIGYAQPQQPIYPQPGYPQPGQPQPGYGQPTQQIDPITGLPINGGVMGI